MTAVDIANMVIGITQIIVMILICTFQEIGRVKMQSVEVSLCKAELISIITSDLMSKRPAIQSVQAVQGLIDGKASEMNISPRKLPQAPELLHQVMLQAHSVNMRPVDRHMVSLRAQQILGYPVNTLAIRAGTAVALEAAPEEN